MPSWFWFPDLSSRDGLSGDSVLRGIRSQHQNPALDRTGTVTVVVILDFILTAKGGKSVSRLAALHFGHTLQGLQRHLLRPDLRVTSFIGFETAAVLGEEDEEPAPAIPISVLVAVCFAHRLLRLDHLQHRHRSRGQQGRLHDLGHYPASWHPGQDLCGHTDDDPGRPGRPSVRRSSSALAVLRPPPAPSSRWVGKG